MVGRFNTSLTRSPKTCRPGSRHSRRLKTPLNRRLAQVVLMGWSRANRPLIRLLLREALFGGKPCIAAHQDQFPSRRRLREMSLHDGAVWHGKATDNLRDTATQPRPCQRKCLFDCRSVYHRDLIAQASDRANYVFQMRDSRKRSAQPTWQTKIPTGGRIRTPTYRVPILFRAQARPPRPIAR